MPQACNTTAFPTPLANSFILDSGATDHVCNNRARFHNYTKAGADDYIVAGANTVKIEGWGTVTITIECDETPIGQRTFDLYNIAHIPSFTSNLVLYNRFYDKHLFWDSENQCIKYQGTQVGKTKRIYEQWVLEYNAISSDLSVFLARRSDQPLPLATWTAV